MIARLFSCWWPANCMYNYYTNKPSLHNSAEDETQWDIWKHRADMYDVSTEHLQLRWCLHVEHYMSCTYTTGHVSTLHVMYMHSRSSTCTTGYVHALQVMYVHYRSSTYTTDHVRTLQIMYVNMLWAKAQWSKIVFLKSYSLSVSAKLLY